MNFSRRGFLRQAGSLAAAVLPRPRRPWLRFPAPWPTAAPGPLAALPFPPEARRNVPWTPLEESIRRFQLRAHRFDCERRLELLSPSLEKLQAALARGGAEVERLLSTRFAGVSVAPVREKLLRDASGFRVRQSVWAGQGNDQPRVGTAEFAAGVRHFLAGRLPLGLSDLVCLAITELPGGTKGAPRFETRLRFELADAAKSEIAPEGMRWQATGEWVLEWERNETAGWKISSWRPLEMTVVEGPALVLTDVTAAAFGEDPTYASQLLRDTNTWRAVLDKASGIDIFGNGGVSVGDVDGDGRDEIYLCQPQGLPNRLYRQREPFVFEDVAASAGVDLLDNTSMALFADVLNRGPQDLILITESSPLLFLNDGHGRFTLARNAFPGTINQAALTGAAMADYDRDGFLDLYVCAYAYVKYVQGESVASNPCPYYDAENGPPNTLYHNQGDGTFRDVTVASGLNRGNRRFSFACAWNDFDDDGWPDLFVVNDFGRNNLYRNLGNTRFEEVPEGLPDHGSGMSAAHADVDGDGAAEFYVSNMWVPAGERVTAEPEFRARFADVSPEIVREFAMGNALYRRAARGFEPAPNAAGAYRGRWAWGSDFFDLDNDGRPELYVVNGYLSSPDAGRAPVDAFMWEDIVALSPHNAVVGNEYRAAWAAISLLTHQGHPWNGNERNVFFLNLGDGRFADASAVSGLDYRDDGRAFAVFDYDGDGDRDLILHNRTGPQLRLLRNDLAHGNHSLALRLMGTKGNRDAIGARVEVETATRRQVHYLTCGSGFLSQHSKELVIGLGQETVAKTVRVRWPAGTVAEFAGLEAGHRYYLTEGEKSPRREALERSSPRAAGSNSPAADRSVAAVGTPPHQTVPKSFSTALIEPLPVPLPETMRRPVAPASLPASSSDRHRLLWLWDPSNHDAASLESFFQIQDSVGSQLVLWNEGAPPQAALNALRNPPWQADESFRAVWKTLLSYLYDYLREPEFPTGLLIDEGPAAEPLPIPVLVKVYWGGASRDEIRKDLVGPLPAGKDALPFPGRAILCTFDRDLRTLGAGFAMAGLYPEAEFYLLRAVERNSQDADSLYDLAFARRQLGKIPEAVSNARAALQVRPDLPQAKNLLGVLLAQSGQLREARALFEQSVRELPDFVEAWNNLGYLLLSQNDFAGAEAALNRSLALAPEYPEALNNLGIVKANRGDAQAAAALFERVMAANPDNEQAANNLAVLYANEGKLQEAERILRGLVERGTDDAATFMNLVRLELSLNRNDEAKKLLKDWMARHPQDGQAAEMLRQAESRTPKE